MAAVSDSASAILRASSLPRASRSPMKRTRTRFSCRFAISRTSESRNSFISIPTSSGGRNQFSLEKAKSVR